MEGFMEGILLMIAVVCILSVIGGKLSDKMGVPGLLAFILLGMLFGSDGLVRISFENYHMMEKISTIALMFIMFYGGFGTNMKEARPILAPAILLSTAGVIVTALITGVFASWVLKCSIWEGMLVGAVVSSTDAASVFAILRLKNLNLVGGLASILEIESGSNDPFSYMMTTIILGIMSSSLGDAPALAVLAQIIFGLAGGALIGYLATLVLKNVHLADDNMHYLFLLSVVLLSYVLPVFVGGNGFLSVYIAGVWIGNHKFPQKVDLVHFFDGLTKAMQLLLFFLLGLLANPSQFSGIFIPALLITAFLMFVARPTALFGLLLPFRFNFRQKLFLSFAGLRGAASIVFAIYTVISDAYTKNDIFHIVFCIAIFSVGIQGTLLPQVAKKLNLLDESSDVKKTFNDYQKDTDMNLIELRPSKGNPWIGKSFREISMPEGMLAVMVKRDKRTFIPNGNTVIQEKDRIIISCLNYVDHSQLSLYEEEITKKHKWRDQLVRQISISKGQLIVLIHRGSSYLIPDGNTKLELGNTLVICKDSQRSKDI